MAWFSPPCIYSNPACNHALSLSHTNHCTCDGGRSPETTGVIPRKENRNKKRERTGSKSNRHGCTCTGCMMVQAYRAPNFIGALFSSMLYCTVLSYRPQSGNSLLAQAELASSSLQSSIDPQRATGCARTDESKSNFRSKLSYQTPSHGILSIGRFYSSPIVFPPFLLVRSPFFRLDLGGWMLEPRTLVSSSSKRDMSEAQVFNRGVSAVNTLTAGNFNFKKLFPNLASSVVY